MPDKRLPRSGLGATDEDRAHCSVYFNRVASDVRDLVLNENLQNKRGHFVLKSIAQSFNSRVVDDVLKLAADVSIGAVNLLSDSGGYRFGSLDDVVGWLNKDNISTDVATAYYRGGYNSFRISRRRDWTSAHDG
jgi:hypothetical protein